MSLKENWKTQVVDYSLIMIDDEC